MVRSSGEGDQFSPRGSSGWWINPPFHIGGFNILRICNYTDTPKTARSVPAREPKRETSKMGEEEKGEKWTSLCWHRKRVREEGGPVKGWNDIIRRENDSPHTVTGQAGGTEKYLAYVFRTSKSNKITRTPDMWYNIERVKGCDIEIWYCIGETGNQARPSILFWFIYFFFSF